MTEDELRRSIPQYIAFLWTAPVPYLVFFMGSPLGVPIWVGVLAFAAIPLLPIASLWFSLPVAKRLGRPLTGTVLLTLFVPFGYVFAAISLIRGLKSLP